MTTRCLWVRVNVGIQTIVYIFKARGSIGYVHAVCMKVENMAQKTYNLYSVSLCTSSFNSRSGYVHAMHLSCYGAKLSNLKLKTQPKQLLGFLQ